MEKIIGRERELEKLSDYMQSGRSEFVAVYGRIRVGKTFLIRSFFKDVKLVVCGSATSWILDKLVDGKGGMYGRVTLSIPVEPFTLKECREFFREGGYAMDEYDIVQAYMAFGGIPYYLDQFRRGMSVPQNFDALLYGRQAPLRDEFDRLFSSQFTHPGELQKIVTLEDLFG